MTTGAVHRTIQAVWRIESPKLIARLARIVRDVGRAEELAQDAFLSALTEWPQTGIPRNPGAWLMTTGKRKAIDALRRERTLERTTHDLSADLELRDDTAAAAENAGIDDDLLRLIFVAAHPVLAVPARVALTLRVLGGLTTAEIARAFLVPEATIAQRIVRAKRTLSQARVPFEVPPPGEQRERLGAVLEVIYLIFNEGYAATSGDDVLRPELAEDALRLGRVLAGLMRKEPEVHGLVALMELHASRMRTRVSAQGDPILLLDQDRGKWNHLLIGRGLRALSLAQSLAPAAGPYVLQAEIAACHARARAAAETDWKRIADLYGALVELVPSPVVELNRAVAVSMAYGPQAGLDILDALTDSPALQHYHLLPSARGDLLLKLGRNDEARAAFESAEQLAHNARDRKLLHDRAAAC